MKALPLLLTVTAAFFSTAAAENLEAVQIHLPTGNPVTVYRSVEKMRTVALFVGKESVSSQQTAPRTVRLKSFRQDVPQGQTITVFTPDR